ncbi:glycosyltransferase [Porticoccaceae bacterium]|nr:glycosyltransferase [Porticoccaceae bacterium]
MKVIHAIVSLEIGGAEGMLERLVQESSKNPQIQQSIITLKDEGTIGLRLRMEGFDVISLGMKSFLCAPIVVYKLIRLFKTLRPDAVYTWMYHADLLCGVAAFFCGVKNIIWGIRNSKIPQRSFSVTSAVIKICSVLSFYIPTKIVCCAEAAKLAHVELGFCSSKMVVIPNGYDLSSFNPSSELRDRTRSNLGLSESHLVVGVVGRFDPLKDFKNFIKAASLLSQDLDNVKFLMVGRGLDQENVELNAWIDNSYRPENFILIGEAVPHDLYSAMDVYCLSSKAEGFPNVVAEAMAMRIPCVVTDVGDAARIVGESGLVIDPMNYHALYHGLMSMLSLDKDDRESLGNQARELIESQYDLKIVQRKFIDLVKLA